MLARLDLVALRRRAQVGVRLSCPGHRSGRVCSSVELDGVPGSADPGSDRANLTLQGHQDRRRMHLDP